MTERTLRVKISVDLGDLKGDAAQAAKAFENIGKAAEKAGQNTTAGAQAGGQAVRKVAKDAEDSGGLMEKAAGKAGKFLGAAIAGGAILAGKAILDMGMDYETNLNQLAAVTGAGADKMKELGATAMSLGNDMDLPAASAADAAQAMLELAKGGLTADEAMKSAKGTLTLAAAAQISGAEAATIQSAALNTFSLKAADAGHVADVLANVANASSGEITDFAQGMAQAGLVASSLGISLDDTATTLGIFANQGLSGSDAGTSLKTMLVSLQSPTQQGAAALKELGVTAFDAQGNFVGMRTVTEELSKAQQHMTTQQFAAAASTAFGTDAVRAAVAVAGQGTKGFDNMSTAVSKAGGAQTVAAAQTKGLQGALNNAQNALSNTALEIYQKYSPAITSMVNDVASALPAIGDFFSGTLDVVSKFAGFIGDLPGPVQAAGAALLAVSVMKGPVGDTFTDIGNKIQAFKTRVEETAAPTRSIAQTAAAAASAAVPMGDALKVAASSADVLKAGLEGAAQTAAVSVSATDAVSSSAAPMGEALAIAGAATATLVEGLAGTTEQADGTAAAADGVAAAADPMGSALEGAGLSSEALTEGLGASVEKAKETTAESGRTASGMAKMGAAARIAGGGLMAAFGGPIGIAITAVTAGVSWLVGKMGELDGAATNLTGVIDDQTGAWKDNAAAAVASQLAQSGLLKELSDQGVKGSAVGAIMSGDTDPITKQLEARVNALRDAADAQSYFNEQGIQVTPQSDALDAATKTLNNWNATLGVTADQQTKGKETSLALMQANHEAAMAAGTASIQLKGVNDTMSLYGTNGSVATNSVLGMGKAISGTGSAAAISLPALKDLGGVWADGAVDAGEFASQVGNVIKQMDIMDGRNGDAAAAQRVTNQTIRDYADAQAAAVHGGAADRAVAQAQADQATALAALNKAIKDHGKNSPEAAQASRDYAAAIDTVASKTRDVKAASDHADQATADLQKNFFEAGQAAFNASIKQGDFAGATDAATAAMQGVKQSFIDAQPEADRASGKAQALADKLFGIPAEAATTIKANDAASPTIDAINAKKMNDKFVEIYGHFNAATFFNNGVAGLAATKADGGIVEAGHVTAAANGLLREPMIAKGGANILWAEPETGWEAYISGKPSQLAANQKTLTEAAKRLGMGAFVLGDGAQTYSAAPSTQGVYSATSGQFGSMSSPNLYAQFFIGDRELVDIVDTRISQTPIPGAKLIAAQRQLERS